VRESLQVNCCPGPNTVNTMNSFPYIMESNHRVLKLICQIFIMAVLINGCCDKSQTIEDETLLEPAETFHAVGVTEPIVEYLPEPGFAVPREVSRIAVEVYFDLVPTKMRFSMPCYPCMVTENNIHYSSGWTETYDPAASSSCEVLWDDEARYARMWIESQNPARIVVRVRAALCDPSGYIAHSTIPSSSPYGEGDWTDEWYYIYPDGTHTRHVRIYTGLAGQSLTVTDEQFKGVAPIREIPPTVVHEFHEEFIFGQDGHIPEDDISLEPLTLIKMDGSSKTISYRPYPRDYGTFDQANIMVVNLNSRYRPFTIYIPHGIENQPYPLEGRTPHTFQTWPSNPGEEGYSVSLGHTINWWHYRRTDCILEQVYLSGMIASDDPAETIIELAKSWLHYPRLMMEDSELSYTEPSYDQAQKAYIVPRNDQGPRQFRFELGFPDRFQEEIPLPVSIVNPAFVIKDWGTARVELRVNGSIVKPGKNYRIGYEQTNTGTNLIIWLNHRAQESTRIEINPVHDE
jgi:hypothetical protein